MHAERGKLSRHTDVAKAMNYMLKRWEAFTRFLGDGRIRLTNNAAKRALRCGSRQEELVVHGYAPSSPMCYPVSSTILPPGYMNCSHGTGADRNRTLELPDNRHAKHPLRTGRMDTINLVTKPFRPRSE
jgi:hypothetical protein